MDLNWCFCSFSYLFSSHLFIFLCFCIFYIASIYLGVTLVKWFWLTQIPAAWSENTYFLKYTTNAGRSVRKTGEEECLLAARIFLHVTSEHRTLSALSVWCVQISACLNVCGSSDVNIKGDVKGFSSPVQCLNQLEPGFYHLSPWGSFKSPGFMFCFPASPTNSRVGVSV